MSYVISEYTKKKDRELNVTVKPSTNAKKKVDVFSKDGKKIASIGARGMMDYPLYIKEKGLEFANERKRLYKIRHKKDLNQGNGYWAQALLW